MIRRLFATDDNTATAILRVVLGLVFFAHGAQKMLGWFGGYGFSGTMGFFTGAMHIPAPLAFLAIAAEFFGGLGLILGFLTRIAAFGIAVNMLVAIAAVHGAFGFFMNWSGTQKLPTHPAGVPQSNRQLDHVTSSSAGRVAVHYMGISEQ